MAKIKVLPEFVINRIAAGEVVERPASVVKELVENSLDAEADRVEVELEIGGCRLVKVTDNGVGMPPDDLRLAWLRYATSKLSSPEELNHIQTLGFRGEALPSIGAVSQATMISRPRGSLEGAKITVAGGRLGEVAAVGAPEGTTVEVCNLFFNTPVRKKFLRTPKTEEAHAGEVFTRLALAHPAVAFHLKCDGRQTLRLPGRVELIERIRGLFGGDLVKQLAPIRSETTVLRVKGYAGPPNLHRSNTQMVYTFLNGRYIRDKIVLRAIMESYRALLPAGRFPVVFVLLEMDPSRVDVNVHPCKIEVRFREADALYGQVLDALEDAAKHWSPGPDLQTAPAPRGAAERGAQIRRAIADFFESRPGPRPIVGPATPAGAPGAAPAPARRFCQFRDSYIVEEIEDGINIIDQHALHERILYESLARGDRRGVESQRLLVPEVVELKPRDLQLALELRQAFARVGMEIEEFGGHSVAIRAVPQMLEGVPPSRVLLDTLDELRGESEVASREEIIRRSVACTGAVKAAQPLTQEEIAALLKKRDELHLPPTCPHGRPTTLHLSDAEIARRFQRT